MNYRLSFCQLSVCIVATIFFSSCARQTKPLPLIEGKAVWFQVPETYSFTDRNGSPIVHPFFDHAPFPSVENLEVSMVPLTFVGSEFGYELDLVSGEKFRRHQYCSQKDVWKRTSNSISRPHFTIGYVPRMLDSLGEPQKILVFGKKRYFQDADRYASHAYRTRVVGGIVFQSCSRWPCNRQNPWLSRLVLLAVNPADPTFRDVKSLGQLQKTIDIIKLKAFLENGFGRNVSGAEEVPFYRALSDVTAKRSMRVALKKGKVFSFDEINSLRKGCHRVYDYLYQARTYFINRPEENDQASVEKELKEMREWSRQLRNDQNLTFLYESSKKKFEEFKKKKTEKNIMGKTFHQFFTSFLGEYKKQIRTCFRYVRDSNLNLDRERHWFFSFIRSYVALEDLGYLYLCNRKAWIRNPQKVDGTYVYSYEKERAQCSGTELDEAFSSSITILTGLQRSKRAHYRYIQYDEGVGGSHQKIYNWVYFNGAELSCKREQNEVPFPSDINWTPLGKEDESVLIRGRVFQ